MIIMRILLISLFIFILLSIPIHAITQELRIENPIDYNFTINNKLKIINHEFIINDIKIKPFISILNKEQDLSKINYSSIIKDNKFNYEFGFRLNVLSLSNINYIGFDLINMKKLDDISYTDGKIRIIFDDLINKGNLQLLYDKVILYNPTSLTIDPTIELLPNSTNKAYKNTTISSSSCVFRDAIEFTNTEYSQVNVSDNTRYNQNMIFSLKNSYTYYKFKFNLTTTNINISSINQMNFTHEGFESSSSDCTIDGTCIVTLYYYNVTSQSWRYWANLNEDSETTLTKSFSNSSQLINSTDNITQFGICLFGPRFAIDIVSSYTDFAYLNVTYTAEEPPIQNITRCEYICTPQIKSEKNPLLEYYARSSLSLINDKNTLLFYNLNNDNLNNDCLIYWHDYLNKNNNLCINLNSGKVIYIKDFNEKNMGFNSYWYVFHAFLKSIFG